MIECGMSAGLPQVRTGPMESIPRTGERAGGLRPAARLIALLTLPCITLHPGDALASCSGDKTVRIWMRDPAAVAAAAASEVSSNDSSSSKPWRCSAVLEDAHTRTVRCAAWAPSGRQLATASFDRTTAIWSRDRSGVWENVAMLEGHESEVKGVAWNPNGCLLATCRFEAVDSACIDATMGSWQPSMSLKAPPPDAYPQSGQDGVGVGGCTRGRVRGGGCKAWPLSGAAGAGGCSASGAGEATPHTGGPRIPAARLIAQDVKTVAWHPSGEVLVSASYDDSIKLWVRVCGRPHSLPRRPDPGCRVRVLHCEHLGAAAIAQAPLPLPAATCLHRLRARTSGFAHRRWQGRGWATSRLCGTWPLTPQGPTWPLCLTTEHCASGNAADSRVR